VKMRQHFADCSYDSNQIALRTRSQALARSRPKTSESRASSCASNATVISSWSATAAAHFPDLHGR